VEKPIFTTPTLTTNLMTLGEVLAMYLLPNRRAGRGEDQMPALDPSSGTLASAAGILHGF
jgi:hypothetical protein